MIQILPESAMAIRPINGAIATDGHSIPLHPEVVRVAVPYSDASLRPAHSCPVPTASQHQWRPVMDPQLLSLPILDDVHGFC